MCNHTCTNITGLIASRHYIGILNIAIWQKLQWCTCNYECWSSNGLLACGGGGDVKGAAILFLFEVGGGKHSPSTLAFETSKGFNFRWKKSVYSSVEWVIVIASVQLEKKIGLLCPPPFLAIEIKWLFLLKYNWFVIHQASSMMSCRRVVDLFWHPWPTIIQYGAAQQVQVGMVMVELMPTAPI